MEARPFLTPFIRELSLLKSRPCDLAMISWVPFLAALVLYWIFSTGLARNLPVYIMDDDRTSTTRQIIRMLDATPVLDINGYVLNNLEAEKVLRGVNAYAVIHIPRHTTRNIKQGVPANIILFDNTQFANHSSLIESTVQNVIGTISAGIQMQTLAAEGVPLQALENTAQPLQVNAFPLFNIAVNYEEFIGISLIPAVLYILAMTGGAWSVGRELRDRTIDQWLVSQKTLSILPALIAKLCMPWFCFSVTGSIFFIYATIANEWSILGSLAWICLSFSALIAVSLSIGALLAAVTMSMRTALSGSGLISAPSFAFSGAAFPLLSMTPSAKLWAIIMPFTHYANLQIGQTSAGEAVSGTSDVVAYMIIATISFLVLSSIALKRALQHPDRWGER